MSADSNYLATMEKQMQKWDASVDALAAKDLRENRAAAQQCFKEMQAGRL